MFTTRTFPRYFILGLITFLKLQYSMASYVSVSCKKKCLIKDGVVRGDEVDDIDLKFSIRSTDFRLFQILYNKNTAVVLTSKGELSLDPTAPKFIQCSNATKTSVGYDFTLQLLKLNQSMQDIELTHTITLHNYTTFTKSFRMDILYGPKLLSGGLNSTYNVTETHEIKLQVRMSGKPRPILFVRFDAKKYQVNSTGESGTYNYSAVIKNVRRHQCGKLLSISYQDHKNVTLGQNATVFVVFKPEAPQLKLRKADTKLNRVAMEWEKIESGDCLVAYQLNYTTYNRNETNQTHVNIYDSTNSTLSFGPNTPWVIVRAQAWVNGQGSSFSNTLNVSLADSDKPKPIPVSKGLSGGAVAGVVIAVLLVAVIGGFLFVKRKILRQFIDNRVNNNRT